MEVIEMTVTDDIAALSEGFGHLETADAAYRVLDEIQTLKARLAAAEITAVAAVATRTLQANRPKRPPAPADLDGKPDFTQRALYSTLEAKLGQSFTQVRRMVRNSLYLTGELTDTLAAVRTGEIPAGHAHHIATQHHVVRTTEHQAERPTAPAELQTEMLETAKQHPGNNFSQLARSLREEKAPETKRNNHARARAKRFVSISPQSDGMARLYGYLPLDQLAALDTLLQQRTRAKLSNSAVKNGRSRGQIMADEFLFLLRAGATAGQPTPAQEPAANQQPELTGWDRVVPPGIAAPAIPHAAPSLPEARVLVTIPVELFLAAAGKLPAELAQTLTANLPTPQMNGYGPLEQADALRIAAAASEWETLITNPVTGDPIAVGTKRYRPTAPMRRILQARDGTCRIPGCAIPASACEIDHVIPARDGGPTHLSNLVHLCFHHHQLKTAGRWHINHAADPPDGNLTITLPDGSTLNSPKPVFGSGRRTKHW